MLGLQIALLIPSLIFLALVYWSGIIATIGEPGQSLRASRLAPWVIVVWPLCATYALWFFTYNLIMLFS